MNKKINLIESAMKHRQIILAFVLVMMILGIFGLINMPRREYPEFIVRQGVIIALYPGATSLEVEEQLTKDVENYIFGYEEVRKEKTHSISTEGMMIIYVELNQNVHDSDKFWSKLRHGLSELKMQLPVDVLALIGSNDFGDTSALLITMSSEKKSYRQLEDIMEKLETDIRKVSSVSKIKHSGTQKEEVYVYIQQDKLNEYNIDLSTIFATFKIQESLNYSGELDNNKLILPVHLPPHFESEEDLLEQIIYSDPEGNIIRLKDVARVERKYEDTNNFIRNNGNNALLISLEMQKGKNIVQFGEDIKEVLARFSEKTSDDVKINVISDLPDVVDHSISHFMVEFLIAILAVFVVTMILLPFRVALVAGITIPISILITLGIMQMVGIELHIVSLAGLIVVLGMVVDNAIVVIDNHLEKLDQHETPWNAAWKAATELVIPVLSATAAIVASFFPLMLMLTGLAGDFVGTFPVTIGIALGVSMLVAVFLVPFMCYIFIKKGLHKEQTDNTTNKKSFLDHMQNWYDTMLEWTFRNGKTTIALGALSVILGILIFTTVDQRLFPAMERSQFPVEVYLPEGVSLNETEMVIDSLERILSKDERVTNVAGFVGAGSPRFNDLYAPHLPAKNYGQLMVNTISNEATIEILDEYAKKYANIFPEAVIRWKQLAMEEFDSPIEIRISGDSIAELKTEGSKVEQILKTNENITWVRSDWGEMRRGINVKIDQNKANQLGYAKTLVASSLMISLDGIPLTTIWEGDYPISVVLTKEEEQCNSINDLENQYISSPLTLESLPLRSVATLEPEWTEGNICRRNGLRTITIKADLERSVIPSGVFKKIKPQIDQLELPKGINIEYGGDDEATNENMGPLISSLSISLILIFFILIVQFKTTRRALLIMSTILMSILGAALGLKLTGYPFGMTSFIGIIGLVGIVVRNGIILIDYAMHLVINNNLSYKEAAIAAGKRRMRPIFLTSMAAAMGVVPMIISKSPLWGPLGSVICFGMIVGMVLTLMILPVLYWKVSGNGPKNKNQPVV
ncbi:cation transporter [Labilibaculum manganireducens]|uniref:Cation transporter n=1 Tax=Labilibaculum manganireducens TaxID=1940525 RepID=A0A2N3HY52_9BACT|nr:efflux RND transporter permease subunit [Labilibaculum manganireducens]PKQ62982.1 cation transporter [Labilibaculum manganireducens]